MSAVCILTPVVIATWPALGAAVTAAASSMGFEMVSPLASRDIARSTSKATSVRLEVDRSEIVTGQLERDQSIAVTRDGVTIRFSRDARGKASLCVTGAGHPEGELRSLGNALSHAVVQQYVYQKLTDEMRSRGFNIVEEEVGEDRSIRLRVRQWEG